MADSSLPTSRLGRLARFAALGTRAGTGKLAALLGSKDAEAGIANAAADALGNMRGLAVYCLNNACQHRALSDVSYYSG